MNKQERIPSRLFPGWEVGKYKNRYYKDQYVIILHVENCTIHINDGPPFARYPTLIEAIASVDIRIRYLPDLQEDHLSERVVKRIEVYHCSLCGYVHPDDCAIDEIGRRSHKKSTTGYICDDEVKNLGLRHVTNFGRVLDEGEMFNG